MFRAALRFALRRYDATAASSGVAGCSSRSDDLATRLAAHVPTTFSTLTSVSGLLPADVLQATEDRGGLHAVLSSLPRRFALSKIGNVVVVRRKDGDGTNVSAALDAPVGEAAVSKDSLSQAAALSPPPDPEEILPRWAATNRFPRFAVPVDHLVRSRCVLASMYPPICSEDGMRGEPNLNSRVAQTKLREMVVKEVEDYKAELELFELGGEVIVRPKCDAAFRAGIYEARDAWEAQEVNGRAGAANGTYSAPTTMARDGTRAATRGRGQQTSALDTFEDMEGETRDWIDEGRTTVRVQLTKLERWLIQECDALVMPHEWNRTARAMSCRPQRLFAGEHLALQQTLEPRRSLAHVLASVPERFCVEHDRPSRPPLVHYVLQAAYRDYCSARCNTNDERDEEAAIARKLTFLKRQKFPQRDKVRHLSRRLQYLRRPLPMLDHTVFAQAVFDQLPVDGSSVEYSNVLRTFSDEELMCRPRDTRQFLEEFRHLFVACQQGLRSAEVHLMRADSLLSSAVVERENSVSDEEVVVTMFELMPRAMNPGDGYLLNSVRKRLPLRVLRAIEDRGLLSILRNQKDKVELLSSFCDVSPTSRRGRVPHHASSGVEEIATPPNHQIRFRFVGMFHESLMAIYHETQKSPRT